MASARAAGVRTKKKKGGRFRIVKLVLAGLLLLFLVFAAVFGVYFALKLRDASAKIPNLPSVMDELSRKPSVILAVDGTELYRVSNEYRRAVNYASIPKLVINATLAAEDKRFFEHHGVDYWALGRVAFGAASEGKLAGGASTLTMQLAKRVYTSPEKRVDRKVEDIALAIMIERQLTKQQILEMYLNQVYYGEGAFGVQAAADVYFGKALKDLTVSEAATLARCVRRPSRENPFANLDRAIENRDVVLDVMLEEGMITMAQHDEALKEPLRLNKRAFASGERRLYAPYFVDAVLEQLDHQGIDISTGGFRVETTLDPRMQRITEREVARTVRENRRQRVNTAAFVLLDKVGQIKAMAGGVDYDRNQYNMVTQGRRQPGSSFKPFVYATAFQLDAWRPGKAVSNARLTYPPAFPGAKPWVVHNSSNRYGGMVSVQSAIANSYNVCAVRVMEETGATRVSDFCHTNFGFTSQLDPVLPLALGATAVSPIEMARGYSVFMLGGDRFEPYMITRVIGPDGRVVKAFQPEYVRNVLAPHVAAWMDYLLRSVVTSGTGHRAKSVINARGKTGTTSDNRDAWFCGYSDELMGIGWVANEQRGPGDPPRWTYPPMASSAFGGTITVTMWAPIVGECQKLMKERPRDFDAPEGIRSRSYDPPQEPVDEPFPEVVTPLDEIAPGSGTGVVVPPPSEPVEKPTRDPVREPTAAPTSPPDRRTERPANTNYVYYEICAASGKQANFYCPETVRRRYPEGQGPPGVCTVHGPDEPSP